MTTTPVLADELAGIALVCGALTDTDRATLTEAAALLASLGDIPPVDDDLTVRLTLDIRLTPVALSGFPAPDDATRAAFVTGWLRGQIDHHTPVTIRRVHPR